MEKMTITEALAEIKLIKAKTEKLRHLVKANLYHFEQQQPDTGSKALVDSSIQSLVDQEKRLLRIRAAITRANLNNEVTLGTETKSIFEWITWKREVSTLQFSFLNGIQTELKNLENKFRTEPPAFRDKENTLILYKVLWNLDYSTYVAKAQEVADMLQKLDGQLSLKNATIIIEF